METDRSDDDGACAQDSELREGGDGNSLKGVFTEEHIGINKYIPSRSPSYQPPTEDKHVAVGDLYKRIDYERNKNRETFKDKTSYPLKNLDSEYYPPKTQTEFNLDQTDYLIKNSEFLRKSNDFLSKITQDRKYRETSIEFRKKPGSRSDYGFRKKEDNYGVARRSRSLHVDHETSDDENLVSKASADGIHAYTQGIANLLAGYNSGIDTEAEGTTDNPTTPFPTPPPSNPSPTMYHHPMQHSPNLNMRQSSPYPVESTNHQTRHKNNHGYQHNKKGTLRSEKSEKTNNGRENYVSHGREHSSGTLTSRGRVASGRRHQQTENMPTSSSNSSISDNNDKYHDIDHHGRIDLDNGLNGESPPEPAPPEVPPRGPSLHHPGNTHTLRGQRGANQTQENIFVSQEYLMSGSPRNYPGKPPKSPSTGVDHNNEFLQCDRDLAPSKNNTLASQQRLNPGMIGNPQLGMTPAMPVFPLRAPPANYSPYSPSRFHIDKRCQHRCSWKCCAIALILLTVILTALLAYFGAVSSMKHNIDGTSCILVEDAKAVSQDGVDHGASSQSPTEESVSTSTHQNTQTHSQSDTQTQKSSELNQQQLQSHQQITSGNYWPTVTEMTELGIYYKSTILPFQFWNLEMKNKQPSFVRLNLTVPWGSYFAVYGRRNVAPSVTQYDFVEFVKGGRIDNRLKREIDHAVLFIAQEPRIKRKVNQTNERHVQKKPEILEHHDVHKREADVRVDKRSGLNISPSVMLVNVTLLQYLDTGVWFLSIYNDDVRPHELSLIVSEAEGVSTACPNDCSSHGSCYLGKCDCIDGYEGVDCSKSVCPVLCSNHGKYGGGMCHCEEGWKGPECDVPIHDCQVPDCSSHGKCVKGTCTCNNGWKGAFCNEVDCLDPTCSGHGSCINGKCYCKAGWQGANCSALDKQVYQCLPSCSEHGTYDLEIGSCKCEPFWTGSDCSQAECSIDCGPHGRCGQGKCECSDGWTGDRCDLLPCDERCSQHGQCKNGTCVCSQGWNGKHCTLPGCKNACSRHGMCSLEEGEYQCICNEAWAGEDCSIQLEQECNDEVDNDEDGMKDCSDSECCLHPACSEHLMCLSSNDPVEVLLRKQPPSVTASFYQRVKFLIEENSVQSYAHPDEYSESSFWSSFAPRRVSVMRGRVVSRQGLGIVGIRVSVDRDSRFGFTLTRSGGWFDVLVNGGGAVTLQFQRSPFKPLTKTVFVPWNQIVVLPPIQMQLSDTNEDDGDKPTSKNATHSTHPIDLNSLGLYFENTIDFLVLDTCLDHQNVKPIVISSWAAEKHGAMPGLNLVLADTQIVQQSIRISTSELHLMYQSSQAAGYLSLIYMRLTRHEIPPSLTHVHVRVEIEGSVYNKLYESDPNLTHIFAWNKRNVYKQKVYGVVEAKVSLGYQYSTCANIIWETQTATVQGFDVDISDIGGWSLDVHHHYNFHEGILQKGDGTTIRLKSYPRTVKVVMGTGLQRQLKCKDCNGPAKDAKLLTPVALASGPDGSLYVGDFNLVRRINPDGHVYTVAQLSATQVAYQYYLAMSPADGHLYISDPEKHQVLRVLTLDPIQDPSINTEPTVGSGERCIPGDVSNCGDLGPALQAKLTHPKGLAIAADKTMYIADGTNIRAVDSKGIIHTLVGHHGHNNHWQPIPCKSSIPVSQAQLQWPTALALSPLDGTLYFIDDRLVLKISSDLKIKVVAGSALHCQSKNGTQHPASETTDTPAEDVEASGTVLGALLGLAFSPTGELFLAESDSRKINSIKVVDSTGRITNFAGKPTQFCECRNSTSAKDVCCEDDNSNKETLLSSNAKLSQISTIAVSPDGIVYVADQGSLHILALEHYLPVHDENGEFRIPYPPTSEMYVFNRYGQHTSTRDLTSGKTRYTFLYSKNTSFGKLSTVTDASGNKILFLRDYSNVVNTIENTQDHKSDLKISGVGFLVKFSQKGKSEIDLDYESASGLLTSRADSSGGGGGETTILTYDKYGRVQTVILPTGEIVRLRTSLSLEDKLQVEVIRQTGSSVTLTMDGVSAKRMHVAQGPSTIDCVSFKNGSLYTRTSWGGMFHSAPLAAFPLLELSLPIEAEMLHMWSLQETQLADNLNEMHWSYSLIGDINSKTQQIVMRELYVNRTKILGVELDQSASTETFYNTDSEKLLTIKYNNVGLPEVWTPAYGYLTNVTYDRFNRLESWSWGSQKENYSYERHGLLSGVTSSTDGTLGLIYNDFNMLWKLSLPSGRVFQFTYDNEGGIRQITLPSGTKHSFSCQSSLGFIRVTYTPPGSTRSYVQHYSHLGALLQTVYPGDGARVVYRYHPNGLLSEIVHGDGKSEINYSEPVLGAPSEILHFERDLEYKWDLTHSGGKLTEERIDYGSKTGLSNAKLSYEYDDNFRIMLVSGRIGGQNLPELVMGYSPKTGSVTQIGQFTITRTKWNESTVYDGTALFTRTYNPYFQQTQIAVTIHGMEVFRMEFSYDLRSRISQTRTYTRNVGVNTYTNIKNYTWDSDGQLTGVEAQEPWGFKYDANGNLLALNYRGNTIPMEYNVMDRIVKFGEGQYKYDNRGLVIQNAREERFHYNAKGLLIRATKRGRFDVRYFYDHLDRLAARKDNYGNVTQFFYTNHHRQNEVSQIYSPRDGKLMSLVYDDRGHLIYAQVYRHKYYIATDECGTPIMIFNQYGEGIREIMRSPYGHIVYDSNPYLYLPVDFCGGLLDQVTSLVHMRDGKVYDPLIGQWMTPNWENILSRVALPNHLHLYRFNGNDPINVYLKKSQLTDHESWLDILGYNINNLAPQLFPDKSPRVKAALGPTNGGPLVPRGLLKQEIFEDSLTMSSGFIGNINEKKSHVSQLSSLQQSKVKTNSILQGWQNLLNIGKPGANAEPPFGTGILVSRYKNGMAVFNSVPSANPIYKDVFTSVFNRSFLLDLKLLVHGGQDAFFFVKPETWKVSDDRGQLKRLGSQVNTTFHEKEQEMPDIKIHNAGAVINLRYGTTPEKEKNRLLHHAKGQALRKAWHRERDLLRLGFQGSVDWSQFESDEILKNGFSIAYDGEYINDIEKYPELAEDPFNIRFVKKDNSKNRKRKKRNIRVSEVPLNITKTLNKMSKTSDDAQLGRHIQIKTLASDRELINHNYDLEDFRKILADTRQTSFDNIKNSPVDFIQFKDARKVRKKLPNKKCKIWWLSWVETC